MKFVKKNSPQPDRAKSLGAPYCETAMTPLGMVRVFATAQGVRAIDYVGVAEPAPWNNPCEHTTRCIALIQDYFNGENVTWDVPLDMQAGTELQRRVWDEIAAITYGETITYSELAQRAGNANAIRAAASACGKNPLPLIIPCHRVVGKNGGLGGFGWGLPAKQHLLALERHAQSAVAA